MHCSYCGKEIGTLRLLRDSEFCSASHRKSYKERLGRVLSQISDETKTPPPPPARFRTALSPIDGKTTYSMALWQAGNDYHFYGVSRWPMSLPTLAHLQPRELAGDPIANAENGPAPILTLLNESTRQTAFPELNLPAVTGGSEAAAPEVEPEFAKAPPLCRTIVSCLPEVAERWLERSLAAPLASVAACTSRALNVLPSAALHTTPHTTNCATLPAAEPVAAWLQCAAAASPMLRPIGLHLPAPVDVLALDGAPELCGFLPSPAAEPVAVWLASAAIMQPAAFAFDLQLPAQLEAVAPLEIAGALTVASEAAFAEVALSPVDSAVPAALGAPMEFLAGVQMPAAPSAIGNAAMPSATGRTGASQVSGIAGKPTFALSAAPSIAVPTLPALSLAAELEPLPAEEPLVVPGLCERMLPTPQPEPVERFLYAASAAALPAVLPQARPVLAGDLIRTYVPVSNTVFPGLQAEPVMAGVWPRIAETPLESINTVPAFRLPGAASMPAAVRGLSVAPVVRPASKPVPAAPAAAFHSVPAASALPLEFPAIGALAVPSTPAALALSADGPQPEFVETATAAAAAGPIEAVPPVVLQEFQLEARQPAGVPVPQVPVLAARAAEPSQARPRVMEVRPVSMVRVALPQQKQQRPTPAVPQPGLVALEYHIHRMRSESYSRPEWKSVQFAPVPPEFALSAVLENLEDLIKPKAAPVGVFPINARKERPTRSVMMGHILRIAAAVTIITTIWGGAAALKNARRIVRQEDSAFATPNQVLTPESQKAASNKAAEGKGPVNWLRHTVANRASVQVAEDFQGGMPRWTAGQTAKPTNWRRSADGYVTTGALALFAPTSKFTDYKLEFFGQIETKSIGWVVRAKDEKNYHAMKFTTIERGLRPIIAMVHYSVIDGIAGKQTRTPLNVMVHNNRPFQVAVSVRGKRFVTEVDGEEVDTFSEDGLNTGGVGFFSDAGEKARLYWARVTKNDDWLGHVCAFLSGGEAQATAEVWPASIPGNSAPWTPTGDSSILTAAIGLPSLRRTQSPQRQKRCNS